LALAQREIWVAMSSRPQSLTVTAAEGGGTLAIASLVAWLTIQAAA
jgi:hypothetical protein